MATFEVDVEDATYEVEAPDENTAWQWANHTHKNEKLKVLQKNKGVVSSAVFGDVEPETKSIGKGLALGGVGIATLPGTLTKFGGQLAGVPPQFLPESFSDVSNALGIYPRQQSVMETPRDQANRYLERSAQFSVGPGPKMGALAGLTSELGGDAFGTPGAIIGALAPSAIQQVGTRALQKALIGGADDMAQAQQRIRQFENVGINPTLTEVSPSRGWLQNLTAKMLGGGPIERSVQGVRHGQASKAVEDLIPDPTVATKGAEVTVGTTTIEGLKNWKQAQSEIFKTLDNQVDNLMSGTDVYVGNTKQVLDDLLQRVPNNKALSALFADPQMKKFASAIERGAPKQKATSTVGYDWEVPNVVSPHPGFLPHQQFKDFKKWLYQAVQDNETSLVKSMPQRELNKLFSAVKADEAAAAEKVQGAAAAIAARNKHWIGVKEKTDKYFDKLTRLEGHEDQVFSRIMSGAKSDVKTVEATMDALSQGDRNVVVSGVLRRIGLAPAGKQGATGDVFDLETMLTNWNRMNADGRTALTKHNPGLAKSLDDLFTVFSYVKEGGRSLANPSGSGAITYGAGTVMVGGTALASLNIPIITGIAATVAGTAGIQKLATHPPFIKWLAKTMTTKPSEITAQLGRLNAIASMEKDKETKAAMQEVATSLSGPRQIYSEQEQ